MSIQYISINNYKSLVDLEINNPSSFSVFVGPNASGKSNIFEAIDFFYHFIWLTGAETLQLFGGASNLVSRTSEGKGFNIRIKSEGDVEAALFNVSSRDLNLSLDVQPASHSDLDYFAFAAEQQAEYYSKSSGGKQLFAEFWKWKFFTRIFIKHKGIQRFSFNTDQKVSSSCDNFEMVLKRLLKDERIKEEMTEWLQLLIPGFESIEVQSSDLSRDDRIFIYETGSNKPFSSDLISDGTYNIIAILTAVFQSDEPQFLCIEEPENGLHPHVIKELVELFREKCTEGHYIWLITHSQSVIRKLTTEEIIIVDKTEGKTRVKQIKGMNLHGLKMDEALLTNAIGGGLPW